MDTTKISPEPSKTNQELFGGEMWRQWECRPRKLVDMIINKHQRPLTEEGIDSWPIVP